eukprot:jgi/Botrbrau1/5850/Bobra.0366s0031.1
MVQYRPEVAGWDLPFEARGGQRGGDAPSRGAVGPYAELRGPQLRNMVNVHLLVQLTVPRRLQYKPRGSKQGLRNKTPQRLEHESFLRLNLRLSIVTIKDCCHEVWRYSVLWGLRCSGHDEIEVKEPCARQFLRTKGLCSFSLGPS